MSNVIRLKVVELVAKTDDGETITIKGEGGLLIANTEIKNDPGKRATPTRNLQIGMRVDEEHHER